MPTPAISNWVFITEYLVFMTTPALGRRVRDGGRRRTSALVLPRLQVGLVPDGFVLSCAVSNGEARGDQADGEREHVISGGSHGFFRNLKLSQCRVRGAWPEKNSSSVQP